MHRGSARLRPSSWAWALTPDDLKSIHSSLLLSSLAENTATRLNSLFRAESGPTPPIKSVQHLCECLSSPEMSSGFEIGGGDELAFLPQMWDDGNTNWGFDNFDEQDWYADSFVCASRRIYADETRRALWGALGGDDNPNAADEPSSSATYHTASSPPPPPRLSPTPPRRHPPSPA